MKNTKVEEIEIIDLDQEENTEKKSFIKNLKINKKAFIKIGTAVLLATSIGTGIFYYKETRKIPTQKENFENTLRRNNENTLLDEIINSNGNIGNKIRDVNNNLEVKELNPNYNIDLLLCINQLERCINLTNKINNLNYKNKNAINEVDENTKKELSNKKYYVEYVENLINRFNNKNINDIEKARTYQKLNYLRQYYELYVTNNGLTIIEDLLKKSLKGLACETSGLEVEHYDNCKISGNKIFVKKYITVTDPISGAEYTYKIGTSSKIVNTVLNDLYKIQDLKESKEADDKTYEKIATLCVNALNDLKELLETEIYTKNYLFIPEKEEKTKAKGNK